MIPENDVEMLFELIKEQDKQTDKILDIVKTIMANQDRINNYDNIERIIGILEIVSENIINLNNRVMELERQISK